MNAQEPTSLNIRLYGTDEPLPASRRLTAGPLSAELQAGNLRHIRYGGIEVIRAISFIVRDRHWGTYAPQIDQLAVLQEAGRFEVTYQASVDDGTQRLSYAVRITGTPTGLRFGGRANAQTDFETNRTGFVILHPLDGVAGQAAEVEHVDGRIEQTRFPERIAPLQPMSQLRAITHQPRPGLRVCCRMEGDTFEMEDQRNWTDASFKTYVRPLALPWPYTLRPGETVSQDITLTIDADAAPQIKNAAPVGLSIGGPTGPLPTVGAGLSREELADTTVHLERLIALQPRHLIHHFDPRTGRTEDLRQAADIAHRLVAEPWLEVVVASVQDFEKELADLGQAHAHLGSPFQVVLVSPAADLKATLPGSPWPPAPPLPALYRAARQAFPGARLGGGMFSFFTELNRKRPPLDEIDLVTFTTAAIFHAGDDATVIENLESLPSLTASARHIAGHRPFVAGPSAIGMRMNPYGEAPVLNLANTRQAMNENDPRQRGLIGAAWALGYVSHMARGGAQAVTLGGTTAAQGVLAVPQRWPQPGYETAGGYFPIFHVQRLLAGLAGHEMLQVETPDPSCIAAIALRQGQAITLLLANLRPEPQDVLLPFEMKGLCVLDASHFHAAAQNPYFLDALAPASGCHIRLDTHAVARVALPSIHA